MNSNATPTERRVAVSRVAGARVIDCGGAVTGSLAAGLAMARACLADLGEVGLRPLPHRGNRRPGRAGDDRRPGAGVPRVAVCRVAGVGRQVLRDGVRADASARGPRGAFQHIPGKEEAPVAVGVLETHKHPTEEVVAAIVAKLPAVAEHLTLLVAPTTSLAGTAQVVARSVETALHKLHELKFDVTQVVSGYGVAPLPPVATDFVQGIGRTNDAILYGGKVTLWVRADDELLARSGREGAVECVEGPRGAVRRAVQPGTAALLQDRPAAVLAGGGRVPQPEDRRCHRFGKVEPGLVRKSFGLE